MLKEKELKKEKEYLNKTLDIIKSKLDNLKIDISNYDERLNEFRHYVWVDCKALMTSDDIDRQFEFSALLREQKEKEYNLDSKVIKKRKLVKSYDSPYFGKIVFNDEDIYIGSSQINKDLDIVVYDWRAPISSMFYDFGLGKGQYIVNDNRTISGNISQKRQFVIEKSKLVSAIENEQIIEDELLQEILSRETTDKMTNIINTIQKEQNQVIRNLKDKIVITEGVAGSGKTEIALHRIAYLLYHKEEYNSGNILIFSPNNTFTDYISNVLPELSEENVLCTTLSIFAKSYINQDIETYSEFLDRVHNNKIEIDEFSSDIKERLDIFINDYISKITFTNGIALNNKKYSKNELTELLNKYEKLNIMEKLNRISEYLVGNAHIKRKYLKSIRNKLITILNKSINSQDVYNKFLQENNKKPIDNFVRYEHITPYLYTIFSLNDYPESGGIKHIVIDEAQDYSLFQIYLLKKIFIGSSFTILGDINQNLNPYLNYKSLKDYSKEFTKSSYYKLDKAYRSTKNIMDYASKILNISINCFRHNGNEIIERKIDNNIKTTIIKDVKSFNDKRAAIVTSSREESEYLYNLLKEELNVSSPIMDTNNTNIIILPVYIAKGLEFDSVIVYDSNTFSKRLLYVAVTRAQNNLIIYK